MDDSTNQAGPLHNVHPGTVALLSQSARDRSIATLANQVGVIVIGRNEGERLVKCLESVVQAECPAVYVDSGSSDGSVAAAASWNLDILELDPRRPYSAARARNEGFMWLLQNSPDIKFVQFLDGDCTLCAGWVPSAVGALSEDKLRAAVMGDLFERYPDATPYNRLCAMEWRRATGDLQDASGLGGISMMRVDVFRQLGGFRPDVIAGEDSELGIRMCLAGYRITKIDCRMAIHDADIQKFRQWWRRAVRAGHAIGQRAEIHGASVIRDCVRERRSTILWGIALPTVLVLTAYPTGGVSFLGLAAYPMLGIRVWRRRYRLGDGSADAVLYATFIIIAKFANAIGLIKFVLRRFARRYEIIEYK